VTGPGRPVGARGQPPGRGEVSAGLVARLRDVCLALPEAYEEIAWVGVRWRVREQTFAHVLAIEAGWPPAYAAAAGTDGPAAVLMFRSEGPELDALRNGGRPYFAPRWRSDEVGLLLSAGDRDAVDWDEVAELVTDSYCTRAPRRLADEVRRRLG
jgi:YjbR protein